ncbi:MAG: hypothetical protein ACOYT8_04365 [Candidatus Dependentiae bacterium]
MKKIFILTLLLTNLSFGRSWQNPQDIGFEIRNHDRYPITVSLQQLVAENPENPNDVTPVAHLFKNIVVPAKQGTRIAHFQHPLDIHEGIFGLVVDYTNSRTQQAEQRLYLIQPGKTIFVAWENGSLRPQKGRGVFQRTSQSGWSLNNNVTQNDLPIFVPQD